MGNHPALFFFVLGISDFEHFRESGFEIAGQ
jgi:hypothetical protein